MGPKMLHLQQLLSLCRYEAVWVVWHQSNMPEKKQAQALGTCECCALSF